jgi:hypothetical protein
VFVCSRPNTKRHHDRASLQIVSEVGFLICGAFAEWVRQSSVCGSVGYPFEHADSGKVAWPANFFCWKRPKTVGPASLTADLVLPPPGRAGIHLR